MPQSQFDLLLYEHTELYTTITTLAEQYGSGVVPFRKTVLFNEELGADSQAVFAIINQLNHVVGDRVWMLDSVQIGQKETVYRQYLSALEKLQALKIDVPETASSETQKKALHKLIEKGVQLGASEIYLSQKETEANIFFRIHGVVNPIPELMQVSLCRSIIGGAFDWDGAERALTNFNPDSDNSTSIPNIIVNVNNRDTSVTARIYYMSLTDKNKFCAIRLHAGRPKTLKALGIDPPTIALLDSTTRMAQGLVLISGPTGQGKTTTLTGIYLNKPKDKLVVTFDDPIEVEVDDPLIFQSNVNDNPLEDIKTFLRLAADIGGFGEMRTLQQMLATLNLARTGHTVFGTIHATTSLSIIDRLVGMGVQRQELAEDNLLKMLVAQRLVPLLCPQCKQPVSQSALDSWAKLSPEPAWFLEQKSHFYTCNDQGCSECHQGVNGRQIVIEVTVVDEVGRQCIALADNERWLTHLRDTQNWQSLAERTRQLICDGLVDPSVANSIVPNLM